MAEAKKIMARYPEGRQASAVIALLDLAQRQNGGWLSPRGDRVCRRTYLEMAPIRVLRGRHLLHHVQPQAGRPKHFIQVCRTTPCWLRGSDDITKACLEQARSRPGEVTEDGLFTVVEVECLGACANAPMVQINDDYYEDLTPERMAEIIDDLRPARRCQSRLADRPQGSEPAGGRAPPCSRRPPREGAAASPAEEA